MTTTRILSSLVPKLRRNGRAIVGSCLLVLIVLTHSVLYPGQSPSHALSRRFLGALDATQSIFAGDGRFQDTIVRAYEDERRSILANKEYDTYAISRNVSAAAENPLSPDHEAYIGRLRTFVDEYFDGSPHKPNLQTMLERLERHIPPPLLEGGLPRTVASIAKGGKAGTVYGFDRWETKLGPLGWDVHVADDDGMDDWLARLTAGKEGSTGHFQAVWEALPKPVLKSDFLRLVEGYEQR